MTAVKYSLLLKRTCDLDKSTSIFDAGCCTVIFCRIVAPSLVINTSPSGWTTCTSCKLKCRIPKTTVTGHSLVKEVHHLVHPSWSQASPNRVGHSFGSFDVRCPYIFFLRAFPAVAQRNFGTTVTFTSKQETTSGCVLVCSFTFCLRLARCNHRMCAELGRSTMVRCHRIRTTSYTL